MIKEGKVFLEEPSITIEDKNNNNINNNKSMEKDFSSNSKTPNKNLLSVGDSIFISNKKIYCSYMILFICSVASNMSLSSYPAVIDNIKEDYNIDNESSIGLLTTIQYIGQLLGCGIIMIAINYDYRKSIVLIAVGGNIASLLLVSFSKDYYLLAGSRFFNGLFVAFIVIFNPVWVDQFAPKSSNSILMAFHHLESILGTLLGFLITALCSYYINWKSSFVFQSIILGVVFFLVFFINNLLFNSKLKREISSDKFRIVEDLEAESIRRDSIKSLSKSNSLKINQEKDAVTYSTKASTCSLDTLKGDENVNEKIDLNNNINDNRFEIEVDLNKEISTNLEEIKSVKSDDTINKDIKSAVNLRRIVYRLITNKVSNANKILILIFLS